MEGQGRKGQNPIKQAWHTRGSKLGHLRDWNPGPEWQS